jgi:ankyrin repeat protein
MGPTAYNKFSCSAAASCAAEAAAACDTAANCNSYGTSPRWHDGAAAQLYATHWNASRENSNWTLYACAGDAPPPGAVLIKSNAECKSNDEELGMSSTIHDCESKCRAQSGCQYFIFGKGAKAGKCWWEKTTTESCSEGWLLNEYDFFKLKAPAPTPAPTPQPTFAAGSIKVVVPTTVAGLTPTTFTVGVQYAYRKTLAGELPGTAITDIRVSNIAAARRRLLSGRRLSGSVSFDTSIAVASATAAATMKTKVTAVSVATIATKLKANIVTVQASGDYADLAALDVSALTVTVTQAVPVTPPQARVLPSTSMPLGFDASLVVDRACLAALNVTDPAGAAAANGFATHILGGFRYESMCSIYLFALLSAALSYASACPRPSSKFSAVLYWLWCLCYFSQVISAVAVIVILGMSSVRLEALVNSCVALVDGIAMGLAGGGGIFAILEVSLLFYGVNVDMAPTTLATISVCFAAGSAALGAIMGAICDGRSVLGVFAFLSAPFQPTVVALMANVFVGRDLLFVAEYIEGTDVLSITRRAPVARAIGVIASAVCLMYILWAVVCLVGLAFSGAAWYALVFLPVPICLGAVFFPLAWLLKTFLSSKVETPPFRRPALEYVVKETTLKVGSFKMSFKRPVLGCCTCVMKTSTLKVGPFPNASNMFTFTSNHEGNPLPKAITAVLILSPLVVFGSLISLNVFGGLTTVGDTGPAIKACYTGIFEIFRPPHTFSVPDLDLSRLQNMDWPGMAWDMEQYIEATAAFFSLASIASLLRTMSTYVGYAQSILGEDRVSMPQGMADGRNALQGLGLLFLMNPMHSRRAHTRENDDGGIEMIGVVGAEEQQYNVVGDVAKRSDIAVAAKAGDENEVKRLLLDRVAKADSASERAALFAAAQEAAELVGGEKIMRLLLDDGIVIDGEGGAQLLRLTIAARKHRARSQERDEVEALLRERGAALSPRERETQELQRQCRNGDVATIAQLLGGGADVETKGSCHRAQAREDDDGGIVMTGAVGAAERQLGGTVRPTAGDEVLLVGRKGDVSFATITEDDGNDRESAPECYRLQRPDGSSGWYKEAQVTYMTVLMAAAAGGHIAVLQLLLERCATADGEDGAAALSAAVAGGHVGAARLLLDRGATADGESGTAALSAAAAGGHVEAARLLLDRGATASGESGAAALSAAAAAGGQGGVVRLLLDRGAKADGEGGAAALRLAKGDAVKELLYKHGAILTLLEECRYGNVTAIAQLLDGGTDVNAKRSRLGSMVKLMVGDEVLIVGGEGEGSFATITTRYFEVEKIKQKRTGYETIRHLMREGAPPTSRRGDQPKDGDFILAGARCGSGYYTKAHLLHRCFADMTVTDVEDLGALQALCPRNLVLATALVAGVMSGHVEAVRLLLDRGAKADGEGGAAALRVTECDELRALLIAHGAPSSLLGECRYGNVAATTQLLDDGADLEAKDNSRVRHKVGDEVLVVDGFGKGSFAAIEKAEASDRMFYWLEGLSAATDYAGGDRRGQTKWYRHKQLTKQVTALMAAAAGGHVLAARLLLDRGAKADGESGAAALRLAKSDEMKVLLRERGAGLIDGCAAGNLAAIVEALDFGADIETADGAGKTALVVVVASGHVKVVRLLLDRGAKADGESGTVALRMAKDDKVKALLREHGATLTLLEECRDGNVTAIATLLDGGADVEAMPEKRRPTVGDEVLIVGGKGKGSLATIAHDYHDSERYKLQGASCGSGYYKEAQVTLQALTAAALGGHLEAVRLLLDRGAKADGEGGAAALRLAKGDAVKELLYKHGAILTLVEECRNGNVAAIATLLDGGADVQGESGAPALRAAKSDDVKALLRERGAMHTLVEECRYGNVTAIAQLLDGGADVNAKGSWLGGGLRPTVGEEVLIVSGKGTGSFAIITKDNPRDEQRREQEREDREQEREDRERGVIIIPSSADKTSPPFTLEGASCGSCGYNEAQLTLQMTALSAAAAGGHVEAARLLLDRGAKADSESGTAALRHAKGNTMKALLRVTR